MTELPPDFADESKFYRDRAMWVEWLLEQPDLHPTVRVVGIWIAMRINADDKRAWPKVTTIASKLGLTPRTVIRAIQKLEGEGVLIVDRSRRRGKRTAVNSYRLRLPWA